MLFCWSESLPHDALIAYCIPLESQQTVLQRLIDNVGAQFPDLERSIHINTSTSLSDVTVIQSALTLIHIPDHKVALSEWLRRLQSRAAFQ